MIITRVLSRQRPWLFARRGAEGGVEINDNQRARGAWYTAHGLVYSRVHVFVGLARARQTTSLWTSLVGLPSFSANMN